MDSDKLKRLKEILAVANQDVPSSKGVATLVGQIIKAVKDSQVILRSEIETGKSEAKSSIRRLETALQASEDKLASIISKANESTQDKAYKQLSNEVYKLEKAIKDIPQFNSSTLEGKWSAVVSDIQRDIDDLKLKIPDAKAVRDMLESLVDDERLDVSAIKGIGKINKETEDAILMRATGILDSRTSFLINKVSNLQQQVNSLSTAGGAGFSLLTATGDVNGSNLEFVFASAPSVIVVDQGRVMRKVSSDGNENWTGTTTVTLQIAPTSDIYGY